MGLPRSIIQALETVAGSQNVETDEAVLAAYTRDISCLLTDAWPDVVVRVKDVPTIQKILYIASRERIPVTPVSSSAAIGHNWKLCLHGGILLDLRGMNKIIEVDERLAYAVIEPGVTFDQLYRTLEEEYGGRLKFNTISASPKASVLANYLEGGGYTPIPDNRDNIVSLEVVLPTGEVIQTGSWAMPNCKTKWTFKWGYGPWIQGLFYCSRGILGIITKMAIRLMPAWKAFDWFIYTTDDVGEAFDFMRPLVLGHIIAGGFTIGNWYNALSTVEKYPFKLTGGKKPLPEDYCQKLREKWAIKKWYALGGIYGLAEEVQVKKDFVEKHVKNFSGLTPVEDPLKITDIRTKVKNMQGIPEKGHWSWVTHRGGGLNWYNAMARAIPEDARELEQVSEKTAHHYGFEYSVKWLWGISSWHHIGFLQYNPNDPDEVHRARDFMVKIHEIYNELGYLDYRMDPSVEHLFFSKLGVYGTVLTKIKNLFDPNKIMNLGKMMF